MSAIFRVLPERIIVREPGVKTSRSGAQTDDWDNPVEVGNFPAAVQGLTGTEFAEEGREAARARYRVYMHPDADVSRKSRLSWDDKVLEVRGQPRVVYSLLTGEAHHLEIDVWEGVG